MFKVLPANIAQDSRGPFVVFVRVMEQGSKRVEACTASETVHCEIIQFKRDHANADIFVVNHSVLRYQVVYQFVQIRDVFGAKLARYTRYVDVHDGVPVVVHRLLFDFVAYVDVLMIFQV